MSIDGFPFEGRDVTAAQLKREGITYSEAVIQSALEAGCSSLAALIGFCEQRLATGRRQTNRRGREAWGRVHAM